MPIIIYGRYIIIHDIITIIRSHRFRRRSAARAPEPDRKGTAAEPTGWTPHRAHWSAPCIRRPDWSRRPARAMCAACDGGRTPVRGRARALHSRRRRRWVGGPHQQRTWNQNHLFSRTQSFAFSSATHTGERARRCTAQWVRRRYTTYITAAILQFYFFIFARLRLHVFLRYL